MIEPYALARWWAPVHCLGCGHIEAFAYVAPDVRRLYCLRCQLRRRVS